MASNGQQGSNCGRKEEKEETMEWMDEEEETLDYEADEYCPEELDKGIKELSRKKAQAVTAPSIAEENGETITRSEWE